MQISQKKGKKKALQGMWVFYAKIQYLYFKGNYFNYKNNVLTTRIVINDYHK